ncbi:MAG: hypothetical protein Q8Q31_05325 [Nanoarchaeota archaeon]|nr:hypothetical protein [Nanoarchaeota archaeon]
MKNILFVCKYNRFRSKVAETVFNKLNKNSKIKARSAGVIKGRPLAPETIRAAREVGVIIKNPTQGLSTKLLLWQDTTIIVADDVPTQIFKENKLYGKKTIVWKVPDIHHNDVPKIQRVIKVIEKKVGELVKDMGCVQSP